MSAVGVELTPAECAGLSKRLKDAMASDSQDTKTLKDILDVLNASNAKGKLVNIKAAKLGNPVQKLSNHDDPGIKAVAAGLVQKWKALANDKVKPAAGGPAAAAAAGAPSPSAPPEATVPKTEPKPEPAEATNEAARPTPAATASSSSSDRKPGQVVPTGDAIRDSVVQKLHEVFKKGVATHEAFLRGHDSDPAAMAQECEEAMHEKLGGVSKDYKARYRTLMFNLQDAKNPDFIQGVMMGMHVVTNLATMDVKEMASNARKQQQLKYSEDAKMALMDKKSYEKYAGKEVVDGILKCPKCKSMKTEYTEVQTRSADEPTTKKCFCNDCGYRWKFC